MRKHYDCTVTRQFSGPGRVEFTATQNANGTWYATASGFIGGCSRDYASPLAAIESLLNAECAWIIGNRLADCERN